MPDAASSAIAESPLLQCLRDLLQHRAGTMLFPGCPRPVTENGGGVRAWPALTNAALLYKKSWCQRSPLVGQDFLQASPMSEPLHTQSSFLFTLLSQVLDQIRGLTLSPLSFVGLTLNKYPALQTLSWLPR